MDDLLAAHRKQLRDLQSVITQKKKQATKKSRRGINDDCDRLERELKAKQNAEITALQNELDPSITEDNLEAARLGETENKTKATDDELASQLQDVGLHNTASTTAATPTNHERLAPTTTTAAPSTTTADSNTDRSGGSSKKPNRQKARLARRAAHIEEITAEAAAEAANQPDLRAVEAARMNELFKEHNLLEIQIAPDGHCLYSAFAAGLEHADIPLSPDTAQALAVTETNTDTTTKTDTGDQQPAAEPATGKQKRRGYALTRRAAGDYIASHADDFIPFLEENTTIEEHVRKVTETAEWGGQMELLALAKRYGVTVKIVQAQGVGVTAMNEGEEGSKADVWLAYHRRGYGLGEHYNALRKTS
ncbi:hypothetical protein Dda_4576 [Drechslerella dactyloides]|uniref:OTU domain-containing protein n=1 Tax=Drechslerella dactyloides TaxID=74499 RepID=A0AAD6NJH6_DREDA|nr:hypothetical protein Dda_4576 [Drechslerella dactyloides]